MPATPCTCITRWSLGEPDRDGEVIVHDLTCPVAWHRAEAELHAIA